MGPYELLADLEVVLTSSRSIVSTGEGDLLVDVTGGVLADVNLRLSVSGDECETSVTHRLIRFTP